MTASWCAPARPAATVLRELARRRGPEVRMALVEDPTEAVLDRWGIEDLPTWLVLRAGTDDEAGSRPGAGPGEPARLDLDGVPAPLPCGQPSTGDRGRAPASSEGLSGAWTVLSRHAGALPKHAVDGLLDGVLRSELPADL